MSTGNRELYVTLRNIFYVFCIWVLFNHSVRLLAMRARSSGDILTYASSTTLKSLDIFRRRTGDFIGRVKRYCPESIEEGCHKGVDMWREGTGVN